MTWIVCLVGLKSAAHFELTCHKQIHIVAILCSSATTPLHLSLPYRASLQHLCTYVESVFCCTYLFYMNFSQDNVFGMFAVGEAKETEVKAWPCQVAWDVLSKFFFFLFFFFSAAASLDNFPVYVCHLCSTVIHLTAKMFVRSCIF